MSTDTKKHETQFKVFVNGREREVSEEKLSYKEVVFLAYAEYVDSEDVRYTVLFHHADQKPSEGELAKGVSVHIKSGTSFDVTKTIRS